MTSTPCITLPNPNPHGAPLHVAAELPEWLAVHVFLPGTGVQLRHVLVTERNPDKARECESYVVQLDDICDATERTAILEAAGDAMEHILAGIAPATTPALSPEHPNFNAPTHRRERTMAAIASMREAENAMGTALTALAWSVGGWTMPKDSAMPGEAAKMLGQYVHPEQAPSAVAMKEWIGWLAAEALKQSHDAAEAARKRWETANPHDRSVDWADCSGEVVR